MTILGTGTEIVECVRIAKMIETHGEQFLERVYTANEIEYCLRSAATSTQNFAKRWAAKEATMKAMKCRNQGVRWTDIEIVVSGDGPLIYLGGAAAIWAEQVGIEKLHVSLGACRTHATAYVLATDELE